MAVSTNQQQSNGKNKTILCAIYTRKSSDENLNSDFTSLDSQREYCQSFIKSREPEGWRVYPESYDDPGFSGGNMDRPALKKLLADVRAGKFQVVVCYKYDRLSRNTKDFLHVLDIFDRYGAAFVSVTQPIDTTSSVGRLMRSILMDFAQFEREMIGERTRDKLAAMARKGKRVGGRLLIGYDIDQEKKTIKANQEEADIANEMFKIYLNTRSLVETSRILNEKGYRLKKWISRNGKPCGGSKFNGANLWNHLKNPIYIGKIRYKGEVLAGEHSGIVPEEIFDDVQAALAKNGDGRRKRHIPKRKRVHILGGLVRCTVCNTTMTASHSHPRKDQWFYYYRCLSVIKSGKSGCKIGSVPAESLEDFILDRLRLLSENTELVERITAEARMASNHSIPEKKAEKSNTASLLGSLDSEKRNLLAVLGKEGTNSSRYSIIMERLDECKVEEEALKAKLLRLENELNQLETQTIDAEVLRGNLDNFLKVFGRLREEEQQEFLSILIKEIRYDGENKRVKIILRPLPPAWSKLDVLEGLFDYHQRTLRD